MSDDANAAAGEPTTEQIVALLFGAAMSGDESAWSRENAIDPKLLQYWKFTHAQEYIAYLETVLRMMKRRTGPGGNTIPSR
jgi:hypothetical protein